MLACKAINVEGSFERSNVMFLFLLRSNVFVYYSNCEIQTLSKSREQRNKVETCYVEKIDGQNCN